MPERSDGAAHPSTGRPAPPPQPCQRPDGSCPSWATCSANWRGPLSSLDRGEVSRGSPDRSTGELPTSMPKPREKAVRDRRNARLDDVAASRAFDICDVNPGDQTLTMGRSRLALPLRSALCDLLEGQLAVVEKTKERRVSRAVSAHPLPDKPGRWPSRYLDKRWHRLRRVLPYSFRTSKRSPGSRERGQSRSVRRATGGLRSSYWP